MRPLFSPSIALFASPVAARSPHARDVQGCQPGAFDALPAPAPAHAARRGAVARSLPR